MISRSVPGCAGGGTSSRGRRPGELVDEIMGSHLEDVRRLAGLGRVADAHEVAVGVLAGLYACNDAAGHEVLGYVELADRADEVARLLARLEVPLPDVRPGQAASR
jgi:hypothetical protein